MKLPVIADQSIQRPQRRTGISRCRLGPALMYTRAPIYKASGSEQMVYDPRRWSIWGAADGGQSHDRAASYWPVATSGRCARSATPLASTTVSHPTPSSALRSRAAAPTLAYRMVWAADTATCSRRLVYGSTRMNAAYVSAAHRLWVASGVHRPLCDRGGHRSSLGRSSANSIGGWLEAGYRFAVPTVSMRRALGKRLRRRAGGGLLHAVLQRDRRLWLVGFRASYDVRIVADDPHRARQLGGQELRPRPWQQAVIVRLCSLGA